ncbi:MAG: FkbM family methyltransferase, partial [Ferruginibacter sp.]
MRQPMMMKEFLIPIAHRIKFSLQPKKPFSGRGILLKLADSILTEPTGPLTIKTLDGFKLRIDPVKDKGVERSIYFTGTYEAGTLHVFDHLLKTGDIYFDIGSNIGLMAIFAAKKVGRKGQVHSFEPEPDTFKILEHNCRINSLNNMVLNNIAMGSVEEDAVIYPNLDINRGAASLVKQDGSTGKKVTISTLDKYLANTMINKKIKLLKIDIEGYELEMLKGAAQLLRS